MLSIWISKKLLILYHTIDYYVKLRAMYLWEISELDQKFSDGQRSLVRGFKWL